MSKTVPLKAIADASFREFVKTLQKHLPEPQKIESVKKNLTSVQIQTLKKIGELIETDERENGALQAEEISQKDPKWILRVRIRNILRQAMEEGLIHLGFVQRYGARYGAIPDPTSNWKYIKLPNGFWACWTCGTDVMGAEIRRPVHFREMPGAGSGEVRTETVPYCPQCEEKPSEHGPPIVEGLADGYYRDVEEARVLARNL
ncbi:MAG: hypothetical protein HYS87_03160 [Candidatus Colwellbacteria bacterium]|nr:hypothetical protein [Candidatus Colwellbacteria bacterium]